MDANAMTLQLYSTTLEELQILCAAKLLMKEGKMSAEQAIKWARRLSKVPTRLGLTTEEAAMMVCNLAEKCDIGDLEDASDAALGLYLDKAFLGSMPAEDPLPPADKDDKGDMWVALVMQQCNCCGERFLLQYEGTTAADKKSVIGGYRYLSETCDCEDGFSPVDGPSLGEWAEAVEDDTRLSAAYLETKKAIRQGSKK